MHLFFSKAQFTSPTAIFLFLHLINNKKKTAIIFVNTVYRDPRGYMDYLRNFPGHTNGSFV